MIKGAAIRLLCSLLLFGLFAVSGGFAQAAQPSAAATCLRMLRSVSPSGVCSESSIFSRGGPFTNSMKMYARPSCSAMS